MGKSRRLPHGRSSRSSRAASTPSRDTHGQREDRNQYAPAQQDTYDACDDGYLSSSPRDNRYPPAQVGDTQPYVTSPPATVTADTASTFPYTPLSASQPEYRSHHASGYCSSAAVPQSALAYAVTGTGSYTYATTPSQQYTTHGDGASSWVSNNAAVPGYQSRTDDYRQQGAYDQTATSSYLFSGPTNDAYRGGGSGGGFSAPPPTPFVPASIGSGNTRTGDSDSVRARQGSDTSTQFSSETVTSSSTEQSRRSGRGGDDYQLREFLRSRDSPWSTLQSDRQSSSRR
ncbi:hypothetical protein F5Y15DRAFT_164694 [Xylariaceae sp. FL0016]|nr:hypothetical protein F5Y15DRAFT_164694 [Xylariaceae sp. FL0016]